MQLALAIITTLGALIGLIAYYVKRRDDRTKEFNKELDDDKKKFHDAITSGDDRTVRRMLDKLRRMR